MPSPQTEKNILRDQSPESLATMALNEHGFLFQRRVAEEFAPEIPQRWKLGVEEFPVSLSADGDESRVDFVLTYRPGHGGADWCIAAECKRANPQFKSWLFFDQPQPADNRIFIQAGERVPRGQEWQYFRTLVSVRGRDECHIPSFRCYVEARKNRPGESRAASSTQAIEDALRQSTLCTLGLANAVEGLQWPHYRLVPIVVTTAELYHAVFAPDEVSLVGGQLPANKLTLRPIDFLSVNYPISENTAARSEVRMPARPPDLSALLAGRLLRTVFITRATKVTELLKQIDSMVDRST